MSIAVKRMINGLRRLGELFATGDLKPVPNLSSFEDEPWSFLPPGLAEGESNHRSAFQCL